VETLFVTLIVLAAAAYVARSLLPQAWLPRRLRRASSPADGCNRCGPGVEARRGSDRGPKPGRLSG
jgi:hypothetical protein